ncbi:hypothetical protein MTQ10_24355 [Streptomyces sp. XM83C]|uniref:DprA winged helix domain-containing protein n=1 Tax=Streptomyces thermocoprophilus TaxID=78356 RepID=A0ABV5V8V0_9ACTN|nr:hypothetical protein [Streptomyces sp. XM83C]MCK1822650.1 hypothetical protein [Streptomyces sp. XM83C]
MGHDETDGHAGRRAATARAAYEEREAGLHGGPPGTDPRPAGSREAPDVTGQEHADWSDRHERVFGALTRAQERNGGQAVHLEEIAAQAGLGPEETRALLHDLTTVHRLVTELAGGDRPDLGPRYEVMPRM